MSGWEKGIQEHTGWPRYLVAYPGQRVNEKEVTMLQWVGRSDRISVSWRPDPKKPQFFSKTGLVEGVEFPGESNTVLTDRTIRLRASRNERCLVPMSAITDLKHLDEILGQGSI